jgi:alkylated DNA repair dioxygenase AlkB
MKNSIPVNLFSESLVPEFIQFSHPGEMKIHRTPEGNSYKIILPHAELIYFPSFYSQRKSGNIMNFLLANEEGLDSDSRQWNEYSGEELSEVKFENIHWKHETIKIFGREVFQPRFTALIGDENVSYSYSGRKMQAQQWNSVLKEIKKDIEKEVSQSFNIVLLNWYRGGNDSMGWHSDDEKELGRNPVIASLNLGAARDFKLRMKNKKDYKANIRLTNASLLIMKGEMQHYWQHHIPKRKKVNKARINLTFRRIIH